MVPFASVPETIAHGMSTYRSVFCQEAGFEHVSRYVSGLCLSENETLQGIHAQQVYLEGEENRRRAMQAAVFEAGWDSEELMRQHRCMSCFQTVVTAVVAHLQQIDGVAVEVQLPDFSKAERGYLQMTAQAS
jgi:hypothetical protein